MSTIDEDNDPTIEDYILTYYNIRESPFDLLYYWYCPDSTMAMLNFVLLIFNSEEVNLHHDYGLIILEFLTLEDLEIFTVRAVFSVAMAYHQEQLDG